MFDEKANEKENNVWKPSKKSGWHGLIGALHGFEDPKLVAKADVVARPGYSDIKADEYCEASDRILEIKVKLVAELIRKAKNMVVYTGAGISTNAGVPDYATKAKKSTTKVQRDCLKNLSPLTANPTLTHRILTHMQKAGYIRRWVQQNHDGLAQKAGFPQTEINEIHGSWFNPGNPVIAMKGLLRRDLVEDLEHWVKQADLCLVLGTSLSGMNADRVCTFPMGRFINEKTGFGTVIINIQATQFDTRSSVRIYEDLDKTMRVLAQELGIKATEYERPIKFPDLTKLWVRERVFVVPYNASGELDPSCRMELDLSDLAEIQLVLGKDKGTKGIVTGWKSTHFEITCHYKLTRGKKAKEEKDASRAALAAHLFEKKIRVATLFGSWWIPILVEGKAKMMPLMNCSPKIHIVRSEERGIKPSVVKIIQSFNEDSKG